LQKSLEFEEQHPECRGLLVDMECFFYVIQICVNGDRVEQADQILAFCQQSSIFKQHNTNIQLYSKCFGMVMNGYAKRKTRYALTRIKEIVKTLEEQARASDPKLLDRYTYNILMNAYIGVLGKESANSVKQTIELMHNSADCFGDDNLRPDLTSYASLLKALILGRQPGFAEEVNSILNQVRADSGYAKQMERDAMYLENMVMDAWSKSGDPQAHERARIIFDAMNHPNTVSYNSMMNVYADLGALDEIFSLYKEMRSDFKSKTNKECCPDAHTYGTLLHALQKSNQPDAAQKARQIVNEMPVPNTVAYSTLMNIYAQHGRVGKAVNVLQKMQSDFDAGINPTCCPDQRTYNTLFHALLKSNRADVAEHAEQLFRAFPVSDAIKHNTFLYVYAQEGDFDKILDLLRTIQSEYESGTTKNYLPDMHAYNRVLNAVHKSKLETVAETAQQMFTAIPTPDAISYNILLNIYAERGMGEYAVTLARRMQCSFDADPPNRRACRPNDATRRTLKKALSLVKKDHALHESASDVLEWFQKRRTERT
jgi:pentatricopeptide repeat protein